MENIKKPYPYPKFSEAITKLRPEELLGLAHFMGVRLYTDEKDEEGKPIPEDGIIIINNVLEKYTTLNRKVRRDILKIVKDAGK